MVDKDDRTNTDILLGQVIGELSGVKDQMIEIADGSYKARLVIFGG